MKRSRGSIIEKDNRVIPEKGHNTFIHVLPVVTPVAKKPRPWTCVMEKPKWTEEEKLRFLTSFRRHGTGKWSQIRSIVRARDNAHFREYCAASHECECKCEYENCIASEPTQALVRRGKRDKTPKHNTAKDVGKKVSPTLSPSVVVKTEQVQQREKSRPKQQKIAAESGLKLKPRPSMSNRWERWRLSSGKEKD